MSLFRFSSAAAACFGPMEFFRGASEIFERHKPMTWAAWERVFDLAEKYLLVGAHDRKGELVLRYPVMANAMLQTWRSARKAQRDGATVWQWQQSENHRIMHMISAERRLQEQFREERASRQQQLDVAGAQKIGHKLSGSGRSV